MPFQLFKWFQSFKPLNKSPTIVSGMLLEK